MALRWAVRLPSEEQRAQAWKLALFTPRLLLSKPHNRAGRGRPGSGARLRQLMARRFHLYWRSDWATLWA
eukprot:15332195-Alexandrium_andersonii.AAC.1